MPAVVPARPEPLRRRSVLSVPASDEGKIGKGLSSSADQVVFDLEDAVEPNSKDRAREQLVAALRKLPENDLMSRVTVRVNPARSPWCHLDIAALAELPSVPGSLVLPKVECPGDVDFVDRLLDGLEARASSRRRIGVQALIENASGLARVREIAQAGERLDAIIIGYADLAASLGLAGAAPDRQELWLPAQHAVLVAARAAGLQAIDGPHLGVHVNAAFSAECHRVRDLGFDGKWAIHPRQVDALNEAFTPSAEEVEKARNVLAVLDRAAQDRSAGAVLLDGQMVDEAVAVASRRVLARAGTAT
jgi:citrate lyase subunit beta/citryl-CoA lyase